MQYSITFNTNPRKGPRRIDFIVFKNSQTALTFDIQRDITGFDAEIRIAYQDYTPIVSKSGTSSGNEVSFVFTKSTTPPVDDRSIIPIGTHIYQVVIIDASTGEEMVEYEGEFRVKNKI